VRDTFSDTLGTLTNPVFSPEFNLLISGSDIYLYNAGSGSGSYTKVSSASLTASSYANKRFIRNQGDKFVFYSQELNSSNSNYINFRLELFKITSSSAT